MTSVRNLLPPSSGSSFILLFALLFLSSCGLLKPVTPGQPKTEDKKDNDLDPIGGGKIYNPETGEYEDASDLLLATMDTIYWREISTADYPPITSNASSSSIGSTKIGEGERGTVYYDSYRVGLLLPFQSDRFRAGEQNLSNFSRVALSFYAGAKLALEKLNSEGVSLEVEVFDTKGIKDQFQNLLAQDTSDFLKRAHLLLGTADTRCVQVAASFAKQFEIPLVSPLNANSSVTNDNPFYIQTNPSLSTHLKKLIQHVRDNYESDQVVLVSSGDQQERGRLEFIQDLNQQLAGSAFTPNFEELIITDDTPTLESLDLNPVLRQGRATVFIVPIWPTRSSPDKMKFLQAFLRKATLASQENDIVVYGMRQWQYFRDVDYNYFENLNLHISSEYFVNNGDADVYEFRRAYFDAYGVSPSFEAFRGYDNMLYFGRMLNRYGTRFYEFFDRQQFDGFHTRFEIMPEISIEKNNYGQELPGRIIRLENQYVHILKFDEFYFQAAE